MTSRQVYRLLLTVGWTWAVGFISGGMVALIPHRPWSTIEAVTLLVCGYLTVRVFTRGGW